MLTKIIEATNAPHGGINWGKFMLARFDETEWQRRPAIDPGPDDLGGLFKSRPLLHTVGWTPNHLWVLDLQTGEGAMFYPYGEAVFDLQKHRIWVCPMFEPFLKWVYQQDLTDLAVLPDIVNLDAPSAIYGYRRAGKGQPNENRHGNGPATSRQKGRSPRMERQGHVSPVGPGG